MTEELVSQVALELIPGIGNKGVKHLISYCGSAEKVFTSSANKLRKIPGIGETLVKVIQQSNSKNEAERVIREAEHVDADILHYTDLQYPTLLKQIPDSPNLLFRSGIADLSPKRSIAVVGTRKATEYGKGITNQLVQELSSLGVTVVSGLAYGVDIAAHKACLQHGVPTIAVLAGGIDRIYPSAHKKYAESMLHNGAILTESLPGTKPDRHLFPARNRIIAGMTDATLVVEAAEKGGALITAHLADSYDRMVFAVPGHLGKTYSEGCNHLIATQKALIYTGVKDLVYHLGWDQKEAPSNMPIPDLSDTEEIIYSLLSKSESPLEIDLIAIKTQLSINQVASQLLNLEFKNLVKSMPGKKFGLAKY